MPYNETFGLFFTMTKHFALMGNHIQRSRMPRLQYYLASLAGIEIQYALVDGMTVPDFDAIKTVRHLITQGYSGLNVTFPYKQLASDIIAAPLVEGHDRIGSYNTIKFVDQQLFGANTDYSGFMQGYQYRRPGLAPGHVVLVGAGGVGRAIAFGLAELGASQLSVMDINTQQSDSLVASLVGHGYPALSIAPEQLEVVMASADGLVNCTAIGMYNKPGCVFPEHLIAGQQWAFDAVYIPLKTQFLQACEKAGLTAVSGFDLWIFQGLDAFNLFHGTQLTANENLIAETLSWLE